MGIDAEPGAQSEVHQKEWSNKSDSSADLDRIATVEIDNYHGISVKMVLVYASINLIAFAQLLNLVGSGAYARDIAAAVGGSTKSIWLSQVIVIVTVILGPSVSQAADLWGRKWFLVILTACGFVGSVIVSRANSMGMAIAGETICGLAYGSQPLLYAVASEILPRRYRPAAQGGLNASLAAGGIVGLLAGSAMVKNYTEGFRAYWYMVAAFLAAASIVCAIFYNPPERPLQSSLSTGEKFNRLDWVGYSLLAAFVVLFVMGLSWAENPYPWNDAHVLAPLIMGAAFGVALVIHQARFKKDGLFHHDLFRGDRNFAIVMFIMLIDGAAFFAVNQYFAFEVSILFETDPLRVGLRFCIVFFAAMFSSLVIAIFASYSKIVRSPIVASFILFVIFFALMATVKIGSSTAVWVYPILIGFGIGFSLTCLVTIAQLSTPPALIAITSGLIIAIRSLGGAIGLAVYASIFDTAIAKHLGSDVAAAVLPLGLPLSSLEPFIGALISNDQKALRTIAGVTPQIIGAGVLGLQTAYVTSFRGVWIAAAAFSAVAAIAACCFVEPKTLTMHVDAPLEEETANEQRGSSYEH